MTPSLHALVPALVSRLRRWAWLLLLAMSWSAFAQQASPTTLLSVGPNPAQAGAPVNLRLLAGVAALPMTPVITRSGSTVTVRQQVGFNAIGVPPPPTEYSIGLGGFPPGRYTVAYLATDEQGTAYLPQGSSFLVQANAVPFADPGVLGAIALGALLLGAIALRRR
jgi:hypothetical protein